MNSRFLFPVLGSIVLIAVVIGIGYGIYSLKLQAIEAQVNAPAPPEAPEAVMLAKTRSTKLRASTTSIGTILAPQSVQLKTEVAGTIVKIRIESGKIVAAQEILLQLDASIEEAQLLGAEASMRMGESNYKRTKQAAVAKAISQMELEQSEAQWAQARAEVQRLEAVIRKKTLRAPFQARLGLCDLHIGQYLPEGSSITMLQGVDSYVHVDFSMPQDVADHITVNDPVDIVTNQGTQHAIIVAIDSQADKLTRGILTRARLENPPASLQPNDSVRIELHYGQEIDAIAIPSSALRRAPAGSFVYLQQMDQEGKPRAKRQSVQVGSTSSGEVIIVAGLEPGQTVVADGSFKLREGSLLLDAGHPVSSDKVSEDRALDSLPHVHEATVHEATVN